MRRSSARASVGVAGIVQVGCDLPSARWSVATAQAHPDVVLAAVALHPNEAPEILARQGRTALEDAWAEIDALAADPRVRSVGETGLDYFRTGPEGRDVQEESFRRHIAMAKKHSKALMIHDRDAHDDVVRVLDDEGAPDVVVFHCFSGGPDLAQTCADRGWRHVLRRNGDLPQRRSRCATPWPWLRSTCCSWRPMRRSSRRPRFGAVPTPRI